MRRLINNRLARWLNRRIPAGNDQSLSHQKIFIFPSRFGFAYLALCILIFVLGTNYQNNLMRLLCTFLLSLFLLHLFVSYINFSRLRIKALPSQPATAQTESRLLVKITYQQKPAEGLIHLTWWRPDQVNSLFAAVVNLETNSTQVAMPFLFPTRGVHTLLRLTLRCDYPLGLFKCWTHLDLDQHITVYPFPVKCKPLLFNHGDDDTASTSHSMKGFDEFYSLREFQASDSLSTVAWKQVAKTNEWRVKTFQDPVSLSGWLTINSCQSKDIENQLSELAYQIQILSDKEQIFGLTLPGIIIKPNFGEAHKHNCLSALATYPKGIYGVSDYAGNS